MEFRLQAALSRSRLSLNSESKLQLQAELDVPRRTDGAVPDPEIGARDVRVEGRESAGQSVLATPADERVPVEHIEELSAELQAHFLGNPCVLDDVEVLVVIAESTQVRNTRSRSPIEIEIVGGFKCGLVE